LFCFCWWVFIFLRTLQLITVFFWHLCRNRAVVTKPLLFHFDNPVKKIVTSCNGPFFYINYLWKYFLKNNYNMHIFRHAQK
jgi:hypothetical protein